MNAFATRSPAPATDPLRVYKSKRDFALTPEPAEGGQAMADKWAFVVQKHWASSLHYDFRLELNGTMKSWVVPKGPSLDPSVKRMALEVEDHPLAYADFQGTIPAKQYGAGTMIVWDAGTWRSVHDPQQGLRDGNLKFDLAGHKLHGRWVLVRMKGKGEKQAPWLLIKEKDAYARPAAEYSVVDALPESVKNVTGVQPSAAARGRASGKSLKLPRQRATPEPEIRGRLKASGLPPEAMPSALPPTLAPQLATLATSPPPDAAEWLYEINFDGYRLLVRNDAAGVSLWTRNGHDWTAKLEPLRAAFKRLKLPPGWYDGEIVLPDTTGLPDFGALQQAFDTQRMNDVVLSVVSG